MRVSLSPAALLAAVAVTVMGSACGDLSQEDLLFRAGIPQKSVVAVVPPGTEDEVDDALSQSSQALTSSQRRQAVDERCEGDLLCETRNLARGFNGFTFFLLDVVDAISALPPSQRSPGRRVWGPHFDAEKGTTFRFEMLRSDDGATFSFCLHAARGFVGRAPDVDCDVENDERSGLLRLLTGTFSPSGLVGDQARLGKGTMQLESARLNDLEGEPRLARVTDFVFDNTDGKTDIHIDLIGTTVDGEDRDAAYDFERSAAGDGALAFDVFADIVPGDSLFEARALERIRLGAQWTAERAGRAIGVVDGGNAGDGVFTIEQCWDDALSTVYSKDFDDSSAGDVGLCVVEAPAIDD